MSEMHWPEITKDTPLTEVKRIHQAIWDYIIEHGEKPDTPYLFNSVACEYDCIFNKNEPVCVHCPIFWEKNWDKKTAHPICRGSNGIYTKWYMASREEANKLAQQIRDLPFKYELEEKKNV